MADVKNDAVTQFHYHYFLFIFVQKDHSNEKPDLWLKSESPFRTNTAKKLYNATVPEPILFEFHTFLLACLSIKRHFSKSTIRTEMRETEKGHYIEEIYVLYIMTLISQILRVF